MPKSSRLLQKASKISDDTSSLKGALFIEVTYTSLWQRLIGFTDYVFAAIGILFRGKMEINVHDFDDEALSKMTRVRIPRESDDLEA
ncbi:hypothetical protein NM463_002339 [Citrobacter koseri]|nr:hypothetical protein [Citrobacter koseri]